MKNKSIIVLALLVVLTMIRDKFEKQIIKKYLQRNNFLGKALFLPLIYLCFSIFMLNKLSFATFLLHTMFIVAYGFWFSDDIMVILGLK